MKRTFAALVAGLVLGSAGVGIAASRSLIHAPVGALVRFGGTQIYCSATIRYPRLVSCLDFNHKNGYTVAISDQPGLASVGILRYSSNKIVKKLRQP
jgi:hypothetical protein